MPVDGSTQLTFRLYDTIGAAASFWEETVTAEVAAGYYSVLLGAQTPLDALDLAAAADPHLGISVGTAGELSPRLPISAVPFALSAGHAAQADDVNCTACVTAAEVNFGYAGSSAPGGAASDLACSSCIDATELQNASVTLAKLAPCPALQVLRATASGAWACSAAMSIADNGLVGINQPSPAASLHLRGSMVTPLTGTLTGAAGNAVLNGSGTTFTTELYAGEAIQIGAASYNCCISRH